MQCAKCGGQNPDDAFFCGICGVQLRSSFDAPGPVAMQPGGSLADELNPDEGLLESGANPFTDAEPTAKRMFDNSFAGQPAAPPPSTPPQPGWRPDDPGAGLAPPPPPPLNAPPPPPQMPPVRPNAPAPPQGYGPPPQGYAPPQAPAPQGYAAMGMPADGNTSGMGDGYPVPPEASGWSFGGFIPWGLFSFMNGNSTWGVIGLLTWFFGFSIIYSIIVGINGRESAWRNRRFESRQQYVDTMRAWNLWGLWLLILGFAGILLYIILVFVIVALGAASGF